MSARRGGLCIGRLDAAGETLLAALDYFPAARVQAIGAGRFEMARRAHPCLELLGRLPSEEVRERMRRSAYLIVLQEDDTQDRMVVEAFANALPVIAARGGAAAELVEPGRNGLHFEPGDARELARRLAWAEAFPERMRQMGECALADYRARFVTHWSWPRLYGERRRQARIVG